MLYVFVIYNSRCSDIKSHSINNTSCVLLAKSLLAAFEKMSDLQNRKHFSGMVIFVKNMLVSVMKHVAHDCLSRQTIGATYLRKGYTALRCMGWRMVLKQSGSQPCFLEILELVNGPEADWFSTLFH